MTKLTKSQNNPSPGLKQAEDKFINSLALAIIAIAQEIVEREGKNKSPP